MSDSANPEIFFWIDELMVKKTDPWLEALMECLKKDASYGQLCDAFEVKRRSHRSFDANFVREFSEHLEKAEKPQIAVVLTGTRDVLLALGREQEQTTKFLEEVDPLVVDLLQKYQAHPKHGLLLIGAFPLDEPAEDSHPFSLEGYDALSHKFNSLLMTRVQDRLTKQWNIAFESPCLFFCHENRQLAEGIYDKDGLSLTQGALNHFFESVMLRVKLLDESRRKGLDLLARNEGNLLKQEN